jgi:hypothetical protein
MTKHSVDLASIPAERKPYLAFACWLKKQRFDIKELLLDHDVASSSVTNMLAGKPFHISLNTLSSIFLSRDSRSGLFAMDSGITYEKRPRGHNYTLATDHAETLDAYLQNNMSYLTTLPGLEPPPEPKTPKVKEAKPPREKPPVTLLDGIRYDISPLREGGKSGDKHVLTIELQDLRQPENPLTVWELKKHCRNASHALELQQQAENICNANRKSNSAHEFKLRIQRAWMNNALQR